MTKKTAEERAEEVIKQQIGAFNRKYISNPYQVLRDLEESKRNEEKRRKRKEINAFLDKKVGPLASIVVFLILAFIIWFAYTLNEGASR